MKYLKASWTDRTVHAKNKAMKAIEELKIKKEPVNFNSVHKASGVSKHFLYENEEVKVLIKMERERESERKASWHRKYDKTSKSKDVVIETKDKYIAKLAAKNAQLRKEINQLRAMIYAKK